ncbi:gastrin/cholecystokinin type B receptor-like [Acipenser oxyrinchus oxyrinchus]|uniref:Gastrin/cholecystokinin type B receptor-like n=1 Tax=Acipenser oxyrinchus oxyrinchus TaxID=40147 RepID=A0AAD8D756_ACIOX|nr:gastrin/cholecystokinin type B receptor-like [Acipenser oxyrinchus oxyrinchus]
MNFTEFYLRFGHLFHKNLSFFNNFSFRHSIPFTDNVLFSGREPSTIILVIMYSLSFIIGLVSNIMALRVLTRKRRNQLAGASATRSLLINLAVCDMMVVCICMPVNLGHQVYNAWIFGDFLCRAVPFVQAVSVSASVLSLAVISLNRYYSVHNPLNARSFFTWRKIFWMICVVWVLSSGLCMPLIFMNKTKDLVLLDGLQVITVCMETWPHVKLRQAYNFLLFCSLYGFPVLFNLIICFLTGRKLWSTEDKFKDYACNLAASGSRLKVRKKIAKMVVALVILFTLSWLPLYVVDIWIDFNMPNASAEDEDLDHVQHESILQARPFAQWLGLTNSALNPVCYCFMGNLYRSAKKFRKSYRKMFSSVFSLPLAQTPPINSVPRLLSYRASDENSHQEICGWRDFAFNEYLTKNKSVSAVTVCETIFE